MKPSVSLITPVYNTMPYLASYLDCVKEQTWRPLQFIAADDGSSDGSASYIKDRIKELEASGISVKLLQLEHASQAAAVNAALKEASGEYLTWCDADDIMLPECIEKKVMFLMENPEIGMVRNDGVTIVVDTDECCLPDTKPGDRHTRDIFRELFLQTTYCYAGCYMIRMSLFDECYPDRCIPLSPEGQNLQLLLPPASRTVCGFVPDVLHKYYKRSSGHSSKKRSYTQIRTRILNFSSLFREILPHCSCDRDYYEAEIIRVEKEQLDRLNDSLISHAREAMKQQ